MRWPQCEAVDTSERRERTDLGDRRFRCRPWKRECKERSGTRFNPLQSPTAIVGLGRVRYKLSLRDLPAMFWERGLVCTQEAVREGETQLAPVLSDMLRKHRRGRIGPRWDVDEPDSKGKWVYLYRGVLRSVPSKWQRARDEGLRLVRSLITWML
jgi:hypothetical protein